MNALTYIKELKKQFKCIPMNVKNGMPIEPSNNDIRNWLETKSIRISGVFPRPFYEIELPVDDLVFFPKSNRKCTLR
jgi:hypothetical protein